MLLLSLGATGAILTGLYWLEGKGKVQLNHTAIKICLFGILAYAGYKFLTRLGGFL